MLQLNIEFNLENCERIDELSSYNCNYYKLTGYGDWCSFHGNILQEVCHEDENFFTFAIGNFDASNEFNPVIEWNSDYGCNGIEDFLKSR